jgi:hypothetical protein
MLREHEDHIRPHQARQVQGLVPPSVTEDTHANVRKHTTVRIRRRQANRLKSAQCG